LCITALVDLQNASDDADPPTGTTFCRVLHGWISQPNGSPLKNRTALANIHAAMSETKEGHLITRPNDTTSSSSAEFSTLPNTMTIVEHERRSGEDTHGDGAGEAHTKPNDEEIVYPSGFVLAAIIIALCLAVFLVALDQTIIATAIPRITDRFQSVKDIGWYGAVCPWSFYLPCRALTLS